MNKSDSIVKITAALLKAQKAMGAATKGAKNPYFKSSYADYGSVLEACKELLNDNGVVILQPHVSWEGKNFVETTLVHESGEWITSLTEVVCSKQNDPQALGSAITYARRYGLQSLLAMPTEDDDGEKAMSRPSKEFKKEAPAPVAKTETTASPAAPENKPAEEAPKTKPSFKDRVPAAKPVETAAPVATPPAAPKAKANGKALGW